MMVFLRLLSFVFFSILQVSGEGCLSAKGVLLLLTFSVYAVLTEILENTPFMQHPVLHEVHYLKPGDLCSWPSSIIAA